MSLIHLHANLSHLDSDSHIVNPGPQLCAPGSPSPLLRDVGPITNAISKHRTSQPHPPLPISKGCGWLLVVHWRSWRWRNARGDPGSGRPKQCIQKRATTFVVACFHIQTRARGGLFGLFNGSPTSTTSLTSKCKPEVDFFDFLMTLPPPSSHGFFGSFNASATSTTSLKSKCEPEVVYLVLSMPLS